MLRLANYARLFWPRERAQWSIGIYSGPSPLQLSPHPALGGRPVLTIESLGSIRASGVADPFMLRQKDGWLMFFEVENLLSGRGEIGLAKSADALSWEFDSIVLREPFHLSYPVVWEFDGCHYMTPESSAAGSVRLYRAESFPRVWKFDREILRSPLADATPFQHHDRWWMIALEGFRQGDLLNVYHAKNPTGPWRAHSANPVLQGDRRNSRPAGRVVKFQGSLIRFAQDYQSTYGRMVRAFRITTLTPEQYAEEEIESCAAIGASGQGWNASGMHHVDAHQLGPESWIACVDGRRTIRYLPVADTIQQRTSQLLRKTWP